MDIAALFLLIHDIVVNDDSSTAKLYFQNVSQVFPSLIIASFINNVPIAARVLHEIHRHWCLLEYVLGKKTARQLEDSSVGEFKILHP